MSVLSSLTSSGHPTRCRNCSRSVRRITSTKMPEQTIGSPEEREALVEFLAKVTTKK
jgi:hypothetical protein